MQPVLEILTAVGGALDRVLQASLTLLQQSSSGIQALSAVAIAVLTFWLGRLTRRYADTAGYQVAQMVLQRESELRPVLHVVSARVIEQGQNTPSRMVIGVALRNVGRGPALSVYGHIRHPQFDATRDGFMEVQRGVQLESGVQTPRQVEFAEKRFVSSTGPLLLQPNEEMEVCLRVGDVRLGSGLQSEGGEVFVECRDLLGKWWRTRMGLKLGFTSANNEYRDFSVVSQDQTERFVRIVKPRLVQETLVVDDAPLESDEVAN